MTDFQVRVHSLDDGNNVCLRIWDTAGQEKFA